MLHPQKAGNRLRLLTDNIILLLVKYPTYNIRNVIIIYTSTGGILGGGQEGEISLSKYDLEYTIILCDYKTVIRKSTSKLNFNNVLTIES